MDERGRIDTLALRLTRGLGDRTRKVLVDRYGSATAAVDGGPTAWKEVVSLRGRRGGGEVSTPDRDAAAKVIQEARRKGFWILCYGEEGYPEPLAEIYDPPLVLFGVGELTGPERAKIAMVGSRRASTHAKTAARNLAAELAGEGFCVVSGLAEGIDTEAHVGALEAGGRTIGVLGSGLDVMYPRKNADLAARMVKSGGAVITEHPPGVAPEPQNFPRRNRIISGLCAGVIVVEAAKKSGSLITAAYALDQGREVFAMPGMARAPSAEGVNNLIREGAALTETAEDVLGALKMEAVGQNRPSAKSQPLPLAEGASARVLASLEDSPLDIDTLAARTGLSAAEAGAALMELTLTGQVRQWPGNRFSLDIN